MSESSRHPSFQVLSKAFPVLFLWRHDTKTSDEVYVGLRGKRVASGISALKCVLRHFTQLGKLVVFLKHMFIFCFELIH